MRAKAIDVGLLVANADFDVKQLELTTPIHELDGPGRNWRARVEMCESGVDHKCRLVRFRKVAGWVALQIFSHFRFRREQ
ncbi:MAG TPA: hypothetical protein DDZ51_13720 [Planctomycetaceae bacterium]|nr:hypothetical protein [Planctomycetaceae bacterium]